MENIRTTGDTEIVLDAAPSVSTAAAAPAVTMTGGLTLVMACACGLAAANLYYNQPLLGQIGRSLNAPESSVGVLPTLAQAGYATGLLTLVPLGDILERRRLIVTLFGIVTLLLLAAAFAPTLPLLMLATYTIGVSTVMAQILLPFAVHLTPPADRGRVVGTIMSGLLLGILLSRTISGFVGDAFGWRTMYALAAATMAILAVILRLRLPAFRAAHTMSYPRLMRSVARLVRDQPVLRQAALNGGLVFGAFSAFWATLVFLLESPTYHLGPKAAGLFGLVGAAGALAAPIMGRLADRRSPRLLIGLSCGVIGLAWLCFWAFGAHLWGLIAGVILLDVGVQSAHVSNQTRVYGLLPDAHSRLNTVYMSSYFIGGATGSYLGAVGWHLARWNGVCAVGVGISLLALLLHLVHSPRRTGV